MNAKPQELLLELLSYSKDMGRAEAAARALSERFASLSDISESDFSTVIAVSSLSDSGAMLLSLAAEATARRVTDKFTFGARYSEEETVEYLKHLFIGASEERIYIMCLDAGRRVISCDLVGAGSVNASAFSVRKLVETVVKRRASFVILAHNHPTGYAEPSGDDLVSTEAVAAAFATVRVELLGHYVVSGMNVAKINRDLSIVRSANMSMLKVASDSNMKN